MPAKPIGPGRVRVAPRMPTVRELKIRKQTLAGYDECQGIMATMLGCWAANGQGNEGCQRLEQSLRKCMDKPPVPAGRVTDLNYHLARFLPRLQNKHPSWQKK